jgi:hypothetical protein
MSDEIENSEDFFEEPDDLCSQVANLSASLSNLSEIDPQILSKVRQGKLARMKRQIFDALVYYCECLPQLIEDDKDQED